MMEKNEAAIHEIMKSRDFREAHFQRRKNKARISQKLYTKLSKQVELSWDGSSGLQHDWEKYFPFSMVEMPSQWLTPPWTPHPHSKALVINISVEGESWKGMLQVRVFVHSPPLQHMWGHRICGDTVSCIDWD